MSWNNDHHSSSKSDVRSQADMTTVVNVVNAAAVKYLSDRQLVQQALAATNRAAGRRSTSQHGASTSSDASVYGVRSTELSLASKKYFEKHHLAAKPVQSAGHRQQQRSSQSRIEDLLNSISSQVNGLQMTMSDCKHSPSPSSMSAAVNVDDDMLGGGGRFDNSASSTTRRRSDGVSSVAGDSSQSFPGRIRHDRKSVNSSRASLDESWTSEWMHYQMHHHWLSLDSNKHQGRLYTFKQYFPQVPPTIPLYMSIYLSDMYGLLRKYVNKSKLAYTFPMAMVNWCQTAKF